MTRHLATAARCKETMPQSADEIDSTLMLLCNHLATMFCFLLLQIVHSLLLSAPTVRPYVCHTSWNRIMASKKRGRRSKNHGGPDAAYTDDDGELTTPSPKTTRVSSRAKAAQGRKVVLHVGKQHGRQKPAVTATPRKQDLSGAPDPYDKTSLAHKAEDELQECAEVSATNPSRASATRAHVATPIATAQPTKQQSAPNSSSSATIQLSPEASAAEEEVGRVGVVQRREIKKKPEEVLHREPSPTQSRGVAGVEPASISLGPGELEQPLHVKLNLLACFLSV